MIADLVDVARLDGTHAGQRVPHLGFHAHAMQSAAGAAARAAVCSAHYLRVPLRAASQVEAVGDLLAGQGVPVRRVLPAAGRARAAGRRRWC